MLDKEELWEIRRYTTKQEVDTAVHTLEGILKGIALDNIINKLEIDELNYWCNNHYEFIQNHPFNQLIPLIRTIIKDEIITKEEYEDLLWFIKQLTTENKYYDVITSDIQRLEGILHGIFADNVISDDEIFNLKKWLLNNEQLISVYPYDELESLVIGITQDGIITEDERKILKRFIIEFTESKKMVNISTDEIEKLKKEVCLGGICTINPQIEFNDKAFCFTGISERVKRKDFEKYIIEKGGLYHDNVTNSTNFLIVGTKSNPCWAYSCYGRKVEQAMNLRKVGMTISIINEIDFWDF
jgi:NAD-dependent DNA ligase